MKRTAITALTVAGVLAAGGVAWAVVSGFVVTPDLDTGSVSGSGGANSCQAGSSVTFTVPNPSWSNSLGDYAVSTISYSGITSTCVNLGTADLVLNLVIPPNPNSIANATATDMGATSGTLTLSQPIPYSDAANADYNFLVKDN